MKKGYYITNDKTGHHPEQTVDWVRLKDGGEGSTELLRLPHNIPPLFGFLLFRVGLYQVWTDMEEPWRAASSRGKKITSVEEYYILEADNERNVAVVWRGQGGHFHPLWRVCCAGLPLRVVLVFLEVPRQDSSSRRELHEEKLPAGIHVPRFCCRFQVSMKPCMMGHEVDNCQIDGFWAI